MNKIRYTQQNGVSDQFKKWGLKMEELKNSFFIFFPVDVFYAYNSMEMIK